MSNCTQALLENAPLDPRKLPNYVFGMVLGPTDFRQVLENFEAKHRHSNALLHGSGTVCGLGVWVKPLPGGLDVEIGVSAGFAISARGRWIRVERDQCAPLNQWLQAQAGLPYATPGPGVHRIYVTLCYSQCLTDLVPIAGQQCGPDADNQAPSRILQTFNLQFSWTPPAQPVEDRARLFGALMRRVVVVDESASAPADDDGQRLLDAVRGLALDPLPLDGSLPDASAFLLSAADADAVIRQALNLWVTVVCPAVRPPPEASPLLAPGTDDRLLLGAVEFTVAANGQLSLAFDSLGQLLPDAVVIDDSARPLLLPTRLLQESLSGGLGGPSERTGTLTFTPGAAWPQFGTLAQALPDDLPAGSTIALEIEDSTPPLIDVSAANVVLTVHRPAAGSLPATPMVAATYLSAAPALTSLTVRWRAR